MRSKDLTKKIDSFCYQPTIEFSGGATSYGLSHIMRMRVLEQMRKRERENAFSKP